MISLFSNLTFLNPWVLAGLVLLPALWFLLQITPPGPKRILFPAARLFDGLEPEQTTSSKTPWWILLLRLLVAALVILALAKPVLNPAAELPGVGAIRVVMDNGWESAQTWRSQTQKAQEIITQAGRERRNVYILTTAPEPGETMPKHYGPLSHSEARGILSQLSPQPWNADYLATERLVQKLEIKSVPLSFWMSSGIGGKGLTALLKALQSNGGAELFKPEAAKLPVALKPANLFDTAPKVSVIAPSNLPDGVPMTIEAKNEKGDILLTKDFKYSDQIKDKGIEITLPTLMQNSISQINILGRQGAGTTLILDSRHKKRSVGIVLPPGKEETAPLIEQSYYIRRALSPYAELKTGTIIDLLAVNPSVMILPDIGAMPPDELNALEAWVKQGGLLLRFAGETMTEGQQFLTPVPLRQGGRALDGALTWDKPLSLSAFPEHSPLFGLDIDSDIHVKRQILAEPIAKLEEKTWARLEDGTPLITADNIDKGLIVFIHTTATPEWSNMALSGLFVKMLRRIVNLSSFENTAADASGLFHPIVVLDGFGRRQKPGATVAPIPAQSIDSTKPSSLSPPGLYGNTGQQYALNIGTHLEALSGLPPIPLGVRIRKYEQNHEVEGMPILLAAAMALFMLDWLIMIIMGAGLKLFKKPQSLKSSMAKTAIILTFCLPIFFFAPVSYAQSLSTAVTSNGAPVYASKIHLAYIKSGSQRVDQTAKNGLTALSQILTRRTSVEPGNVVAIDPEKDEMAFFPLIYWPISENSPKLSSAALRKVQYYLDHGGTILFDTRDRISQPRNQNSGGRNAKTLQNIIQGLNIPPLTPMPEDHVLTKSFYLLNTFPGRYENGTLWVEEKSSNGRDGVTSVIIGSHDWAHEWANIDLNNVHGGKTRKQELAYRYGVNLMMYALTGNYKADQVHVPHILQRLGQ